MPKSIVNIPFTLGQIRAAGVNGLRVLDAGHPYDFVTFSVPGGPGCMVGRFAMDPRGSESPHMQYAREGDVVSVSASGIGKAVHLRMTNGVSGPLAVAQYDAKIQLFAWSADQPRPVISSLRREGERLVRISSWDSTTAAGATEILSAVDLPHGSDGALSAVIAIGGPSQALGERAASLRLVQQEYAGSDLIREWVIGPGVVQVTVPLVASEDRAATDAARYRLEIYNPNGSDMTSGFRYLAEFVRRILPESVSYHPSSRLVGIATGAPPTAAPSLAADGWDCLGVTQLVLSFQDDAAATRIVGAETADFALWWFGADGLWHTDGSTLTVTGAADVQPLNVVPGASRFYLQKTAGSDFWWTGKLIGGIDS